MPLAIAALAAATVLVVFAGLNRLADPTAANRLRAALGLRPPGAAAGLLVAVRRWLRAAGSVPAVERFLALFLRLGADEEAVSLEEYMRRARLGLSAGEVVAIYWLCILAGVALAALVVYLAVPGGLPVVGGFVAAAVALAGVIGLPLILRSRLSQRARQITRSLPDLLDRLTLAVEAGLGFEPALRRTAANYPGALGEELRITLRHLALGHTRHQALDSLTARAPSDDVNTFVLAVNQSERLGTPLARILRIQADLMRTRRRQRIEERGHRVPILLLFPLAFCFLPALLLIYLAPPVLNLLLGR